MGLKEEMPLTRKIPSRLGLALDHLITANGWSARELAAEAGVSPSTISAYIWEDALTRERLEELAMVMGLGSADVERAILSARLVLPSSPTPWSPVDPTPEERRIDEKAAALAAGELTEVVLDVRLREVRQEKRRLGLEEGKRLSRELKTYSPADRRTLIEAAPEYQHWGWRTSSASRARRWRPTTRRLGRAGEAVLLIDEVRSLAERLRNSVDLVKTLWLEGNCAAGLGQREEALAKLEQVRHAFESRNLPFDYALSTLDVALLYREEGRFAEIKTLAAEMLESSRPSRSTAKPSVP